MTGEQAGEHVEIFLGIRMDARTSEAPILGQQGSQLRWICSSDLSPASTSEYNLEYKLPELTSLPHLRMWFGERTNGRTSKWHTLRLLRP